jgi:membrane protein required for colicin V production
MLLIDYILLGLFAVSVLVGFFRGFVREAFSLVVWGVAIYAAWRLGEVPDALLRAIESPTLRLWAGRAGIFLLVLVIGGLAGFLIGQLVDKTGLTGTDRVLGMAFGAARGALVVGIAVIVFQFLELDREPWWSESLLIPYGARVAEVIRDFLGTGLDELGERIGTVPAAFEPATE